MKWLRRRHEVVDEPALSAPITSVRIIRDEEALRDSYRRAAELERRAADAMRARADRHEASATSGTSGTSGTITPIRAVEPEIVMPREQERRSFPA
jgi:hypothetical protein